MSSLEKSKQVFKKLNIVKRHNACKFFFRVPLANPEELTIKLL